MSGPTAGEALARDAEPALDVQAELQRRRELLSTFKQATGVKSNKHIYEHRKSSIHKPEFYKWLNGKLPSTSETAKNFERFLTQKVWPSET